MSPIAWFVWLLTVIPTMIYFVIKDMYQHSKGAGKVDDIRKMYES